MTFDNNQWWKRAACAGHPATWWTTDDRRQWPAAVRICLTCPVRQPCLAEAIASQDRGVIRGGTWLLHTPGHTRHTVPLVCAHCGQQPVRITKDRVRRYCGPACTRTAALAGLPTS